MKVYIIITVVNRVGQNVLNYTEPLKTTLY